jgi:hypothetical protein
MTPCDFQSIGRPSDSVREIETPDGLLLLDIRQGLCFGLSTVGAMIWQRLKLNETAGEIFSQLSSQFQNVSAQVIQSDTVELIRDIRDKGLLITGDSINSSSKVPRLLTVFQNHNKEIAPRGHTRLLFWKALFGLMVYDLFQLSSNFLGVYVVVSGWPIAAALPVDDVAERVCQAINRACLWYPKRVLCLQRSAVTTCLLRNCGVPARMTIGAQQFPFRAHAWTEVNGRPLNERREVENIYLVWDRC